MIFLRGAVWGGDLRVWTFTSLCDRRGERPQMQNMTSVLVLVQCIIYNVGAVQNGTSGGRVRDPI